MCPYTPGAKHRRTAHPATDAHGGHGGQPSRRPPWLDTHTRHGPRRATGRPEERPAEDAQRGYFAACCLTVGRIS